MNLPRHICTRSLRQIHCSGSIGGALALRIRFSSHGRKCTKFSAIALSQTTLPEPCNKPTDVERVEVTLLKNLLAGELRSTTYSHGSLQHVTGVNKRACTSESGQCYHKNQLAWQYILLGPMMHDQVLKKSSNLIGVTHEMWYCTNIDNACPQRHLKDNRVDYRTLDRVECGTSRYDNSVADRTIRSGPSPEQLSLVLMRLREELPNYFEKHHQYSIYSKDILFVNKLTRTTTRTLKSYKYLMGLMASAGRLCWAKPSLDILRITKHAEDNTIKVRWTAKGIPWYQFPFLLLSGQPQSLFYRYVDGFSIFEVGRDGLIHCHRLDKVMPTSTPVRQKWSVRMQVLALLGLAEITHEPCEAFHVRSEDILK